MALFTEAQTLEEIMVEHGYNGQPTDDCLFTFENIDGKQVTNT